MTIHRPSTQTLLPALALAISFLLSLNAVSAPSERFDALQLNGLSAYTQLRNEYYIGALYVEQLTADADTLLNADSFRRMQLRITIDRWSPRRFARQWNQLILINNEQSTINKFANQILAFIDMPRDELIAGDIITIDRDPELGTSVYLNDSKVMKVSDNDFFTLLLSTWIGQRPPSTDFKNNLLTLATDPANTEQLKQFQRIKPTSVRERLIASWFAPKPKIANTTAAATIEQPPQPIDNLPPAEDSSVIAQNMTKPELALAPVAGAAVVAAETAAATITAPEQQAEQPKVETNNSQAATPIETPAPIPAVATVIDTSAAAEADTAVELPAADLKQPATTVAQQAEKKADDEQSGLLDVYRSNILKLTYMNTQYPRRAIDRKQEDRIILTVKLDRKGNLLDMVELNKSKYHLLSSAARKAVKKSSPFPAPPKALQGDTIEVDLPFEFQI
jgi:protein TonB